MVDCLSLARSVGETLSEFSEYNESKAVTDSRVRNGLRKFGY